MTLEEREWLAAAGRGVHPTTIARADTVWACPDGVRVRLTDGRVLRVPWDYSLVLAGAGDEARADIECLLDGRVLYWPALLEEILVADLLATAST